MRKSKLLEGVYGVYVVYDKISKHYKDIYFASTDEDFIRLYLPTIVTTTALRELTIFKILLKNVSTLTAIFSHIQDSHLMVKI